MEKGTPSGNIEGEEEEEGENKEKDMNKQM